MMTLEEFGNQRLAAEGVNTSDPAVQTRLKMEVDQVRAAAPGVSDDEIIATQGDVLSKKVTDLVAAGRQTQMAPQAPVQEAAPAAPMPKQTYTDQAAAIQQQFNPEAEAKIREEAKSANFASDMGRRLNAGFRVAAGPQNQAMLDAQYKESQDRNNQGIVDWQEKKKAAIADMEQRIKAGSADNEQLRGEVLRLGLEQALEERKDKAAVARAEADPMSITSEGMRKLAVDYAKTSAPELVPQLEKMSASQIKQYMPFIEKKYLKMIDEQQKQLDRDEKQKERDFKAGESQKDRNARLAAANTTASARIQAANIRASSSGGAPQPKIGDVLRAQKMEGDLDKRQTAAEEKAAAGEETIRLFDRVGELVDQGLSTGPIVGGDNLVGKAYNLVSNKKQEANQIGAQLVSTMAKTFGAAPSDAESRLIREANNILQLDNPGPALAELRAKFERQVLLNRADAQNVARQKDRVRATVGMEPMESGIPTISDKGAYDMLPKGSQYIDGRDGKTKTKG